MIESKRMKWVGHVAQMGRRGMHIGYWLWKARRKRPLHRPRRRSLDNIKMDLREIEWDGVDWIDMAQDRDQLRALVNMVLNPRVPKNAGKLLSGCTISGSSRRAQLREQVSKCDKMWTSLF
jgi:hypothetical protein